MWSFLLSNWRVLLPVIAGFIAIYLLMPQARRRAPVWAGAVAGLAIVFAAVLLFRNDTRFAESLLFWAFAGGAVGSGVLMITQKNPVHAALSFALVVLSSCGLFLLQAAPFLMAATIIIYAGAIVVTFLFVIMLAQQEGPSDADQRSREPFLASLAGGIILAALLCVLQRNYDTRDIDSIYSELQRITRAPDEAELRRILVNAKAAEADKVTLPLVASLQDLLPGNNDVWDLQRAWIAKNVEQAKKKAEALSEAVARKRQERGSLAVYGVPGKKGTPGQLPAANVAAIGRTLFTDYLVPVELAATLLLVATIGAIVIAGRRSEELR